MNTLKNIFAGSAGVWLAGVLVFGFAFGARAAESAEAAMANIMTRTSVREYAEKPVGAETIEKLLRAGMAAPTAMNRQPWHFVVVDGQKNLAPLVKTNPRARMLASAPLAIVVCGDRTRFIGGEGETFWVQDCSAATENILLAAHALGLGAVWTGTYPVSERVKAVSEALKLPENLVPLCTIVIGYPAGPTAPKDKWDPKKVTYFTAE